MTSKERAAMTALCDSVMKLLKDSLADLPRGVAPAFDEDQVKVSPSLSVADCRKMAAANG